MKSSSGIFLSEKQKKKEESISLGGQIRGYSILQG